MLEFLDFLVFLDQPVKRETEAHQVTLVVRELKDQRVYPACQATEEKLDHRALLEILANLDPLVQWDTKEILGPLVQQASREIRVLRDLRGLLGLVALLVLRVLLEKTALQVFQEKEENREYQAFRDNQAHLGLWDLRDRLVILEQLVREEFKDMLDLPVKEVHQEKLEKKELPDQQGLQGPLAHQGPRVRVDFLASGDYQGDRDPKDLQENRVRMGTQAERETKVTGELLGKQEHPAYQVELALLVHLVRQVKKVTRVKSVFQDLPVNKAKRAQRAHQGQRDLSGDQDILVKRVTEVPLVQREIVEMLENWVPQDQMVLPVVWDQSVPMVHLATRVNEVYRVSPA